MTRHINGITAARWLSLAATPVFAGMVLFTILSGGNHSEMRHAIEAASPLSEMGLMYLLMSVFHSAPWLKLIVIRRVARRMRDGSAQHM